MIASICTILTAVASLKLRGINELQKQESQNAVNASALVAVCHMEEAEKARTTSNLGIHGGYGGGDSSANTKDFDADPDDNSPTPVRLSPLYEDSLDPTTRRTAVAR